MYSIVWEEPNGQLYMCQRDTSSTPSELVALFTSSTKDTLFRLAHFKSVYIVFPDCKSHQVFPFHKEITEKDACCLYLKAEVRKV